MAERIAGIALMPRESRNGVYYDTEELKKFDGVSVPLRVEHDKDTHIGEVTFTFDEMKSQVKYEATVFDSEWQDILSNEQYQVSIGASVLEQRELCDEVRAKCLNAPVLNEILELSVVRVPGIPESTLHVIESSNVQYIKILSEEKPQLITSNIQTTEKEKHMTNETLDNKVEEKVKVTIETDGEVEVGKAEAKTEDAAPAVEAPAPTTEEAPKTEIATEKVAERIEKSNEDTLKAVIETVKDAWQPKSEVAESTDSGYVDEAFTDESAKKFLDKVFENGYGRLVIDKEGWIENHTTEGRVTANGSVEEAVSTSGTIPGVKQRANVSIQIGSKTATSIRQYGQFEALPTGQNTARFYRITVPDAGAITESVSSDITASTHTLTSIDVTCSIRGWRQTIL